MNFINWIVFLCFGGMLVCSCSVFRKTLSNKKIPPQTAFLNVPKADTGKKGSGTLKPYKEVITDKAITDSGIFIVHKLNGRYFLEIPASLLNREILIVSRISKSAAMFIRPNNGNMGYAGDAISDIIIKFVKGPDHKIFVKTAYDDERSMDSTKNGLYKAVKNSNLDPIISVFDIKAYSPDSSGIVVDWTDYLNDDNVFLYFNNSQKKAYGLGAQQKDRSYVDSILSLPSNLEIKTVKTYTTSLGDFRTFELNTSLVLLPEKPIVPRYYDKRVGYFCVAYWDYDRPFRQATENDGRTWLITRWRLEPRKEDIDKYLRGELVEPQKPIIFYIDPATPQKWVPYLIQGVNAWQKAFEKAGFKNAIYALEAPIDDPNWSLYDARHSAIVYKASRVSNASGPLIADPRTGEILESHINWYHNVLQLLQQWYFVQASPNDPRARKMEFDDSLMGALIRYVCTHEVGHTLGLMHNMGASSTVPVDSLRSKTYVEANGFCPSIMDYARFNYVAQPEDGMTEKNLFPRIGAYDEWAIEYGYRWFPEDKFKTKDEADAYFHHWVTSRTSNDKRLWCATDASLSNGDPRVQIEGLGDDATKASYYGIKNLQRIMPYLLEWTKESRQYKNESVTVMRKAVLDQYRRYLFHVAKYIGGTEWTKKSWEESGAVLEFTDRKKQKEAVRFLQDQLFDTPYWTMNKDAFFVAGGYAGYQPLVFQKDVLEELMNRSTCMKLLFEESIAPDKAYKLRDFLNDLETGIFRELKQKSVSIDFYRRNLQKLYVEQLIKLLEPAEAGMGIYDDQLSITKTHAANLIHMLTAAIPAAKDELTKWHLIDLKDRLKKAWEKEKAAAGKSDMTGKKDELSNRLFPFETERNDDPETSLKLSYNCWEE